MRQCPNRNYLSNPGLHLSGRNPPKKISGFLNSKQSWRFFFIKQLFLKKGFLIFFEMMGGTKGGRSKAMGNLGGGGHGYNNVYPHQEFSKKLRKFESGKFDLEMIVFCEKKYFPALKPLSFRKTPRNLFFKK